VASCHPLCRNDGCAHQAGRLQKAKHN